MIANNVLSVLSSNNLTTLADIERTARRFALSQSLFLSEGNRAKARKILCISNGAFFNLLLEFPDIATQFPSKKKPPPKKNKTVG